MADRLIRVILTGSSAGAVKAFEDTSVASDASAKEIEASQTKATKNIGKLFMGLGIAAAGGIYVAVKAGMSLQDSQSQLDAAIKSSGESATKYAGALDNTRSKLQGLGFTNVDVNNALSQTTIATQSVSKSISIMSISADLARAKNESLSDASLSVTKAVEGNSRALKQLGIDLPVNAKNAEGLVKAQEALKTSEQTYQALLDTDHAKKTMSAADTIKLQVATEKLHFDQSQLTQAQNAGNLILDALNKRMGGQAAAAAQTFSGKMAVAKAELTDTAAKIGEKLIPVLEDLAKMVASVVDWFSKHKIAAIALATVLTTVLAAAFTVIAVNKIGKMIKAFRDAGTAITGLVEKFTAGAAVTEDSEEALAATSEETGAATSAAFGPIGIAIIAIAAIAFLFATHWKQIWAGVKAVAEDVWNDGLKPAFDAIGDAVDFLTDHWKEFALALGPIGIAIDALSTHWSAVWDGMTDAVMAVWSVLKPIFTAIVDVGIGYIKTNIDILKTVWSAAWGVVSGTLSAAWSVMRPIFGLVKTVGTDYISANIIAFKALWQTTWDAVQTAVTAVWAVLKPIFDAITKGISAVTGVLGKIGGGITGAAGKVGSFLGLASGGSATAGTPYVIGEQGPELFIPSTNGTVVPNDGLGSVGGKSQTIIVQAQTNADPHQIANEVGWVLRTAASGGG